MTEEPHILSGLQGVEYILQIALFSVTVLVFMIFFTSVVIAAPYREGELLVRFKVGVSEKAATRAHNKAGAKVKRKFVGLNVQHISLGPGISVREAIDFYVSHPDVEHVEPNYILNAAIAPNDPDFINQWGLDNVGQSIGGSYGTNDADVDAPEAWDITNGTSSVVVAVIDTGLDSGHEDLSSNVWVNEDEICDNNIDDDDNGYVDDCNGWDFINNDSNPSDDSSEGHGTHVSGIIGAVGNNSLGIAGLSWQVSIMPLKILDAAGVGSVADEIHAIMYAISNGAHVINSSFGGYYESSVFEKDAIEQARQAGLLFVAAAGNSHSNNDTSIFYPASHPIPNIISVASSDFNDGLSWFTNFGRSSVHLTAPGENIYSTRPSDSYDFQSGTSLAASFVSGTVALIIANAPSLNALAVREIILSSVDPVGSDTITGGRLNVNNALNLDLSSVSPVQPTHLNVLGKSESVISLGWTDNSTVEDGFIIERLSQGGSFVQIATVGENMTYYADTGLAEGTTVQYRVYAYNSFGVSQYSNLASATTLIIQKESDDGSDDDDGLCFIATAAFGSPLAPEVEVLRRFRDGVLLKSGAGTKLVNCYYKYSPPIARYISGNSLLRLATRTVLTPVVYGIKYPFAAVALALFALCAILYKRKKEKAKGD